MAITIDDFSKIWASTSPLTPYAFSDDNYKQGWNFIGGTPPSRQMWDFIQKQNDEKLKYLLDNFDDYLPLAGGTMTGNLKGRRTDRSYGVSNQNSDYGLALYGYNGSENSGATAFLFGKDALSNAGNFTIKASDGTNKPALTGKPDGTLTWDNNNVITSAGGTMTGALVGNPITLTSDDGNGNIASFVGNANGTASWNGFDITPQKSSFQPTENDVNVPNNSTKNLMSFTLEKGTWLVQAIAGFAGNSNGYRRLGISTNTTSVNADRFKVVDAPSPGSTAAHLSLITVIPVYSTTTYYINVLQNSGSTLATGGGYVFFKLSDDV